MVNRIPVPLDELTSHQPHYSASQSHYSNLETSYYSVSQQIHIVHRLYFVQQVVCTYKVQRLYLASR